MKIQKIPISTIKPAGYNPRVHLKPGDAEYEKLKRSIKEFGYIDPIIFNSRTGNLVGGHQRLSVLIEEGFSEVEVSIVDLPSDKEKALNIALNRISGAWDDGKLAVLLEELQKIPEFDVGLTGFDAPEISQILDNFHKTKEDDFDPDAALDDIKEPITQKGDLIELGSHRILCGDSSDPESLKILLDGKKAHMVYTDPPYAVSYDDSQRPTGHKKKRKWEPIQADNMGQEEYEVWLGTVFKNLTGFLAKGCPLYVWNGYRQFGPMHLMLNNLEFHIGCVITWVKERFALGYADYNHQSEFCLYGWKEDNGAHKWYGPPNESTVWEVPRDAINTLEHPSQKPAALAQRAMKNSSTRGNIVLDLFLGSGSTLIASESMGRCCFGMEIDPRYCDVIVKRYIAYAGKENVSAELAQKYLKEASDAK